MVKAAFTQKKAGGKGTRSSAAQGEGNPIAKTIGTMNKLAVLAQPIMYKDVADLLESLGEDRAKELLKELRQAGRSIQRPTAWLKSAATKVAAGESSARKSGGRRGGGGRDSPEDLLKRALGLETAPQQRGPQYSPYVAKAVGMLNAQGTLQAPIMYKDAAPHLASVPESLAIDLIKQLSNKAAEIKDPTNWLIASAKKGLEKGNKGTTEMSKTIGVLNRSGKLSEPVKWSSVCGPMLLISDEEASALLRELQQKGSAITNPTSWLQLAAQRVLKSYSTGN
jgi:hypothetical protein